MAATNDITGDAIASRPASENYRNNYDAIFSKPKVPDCSKCVYGAVDCSEINDKPEECKMPEAKNQST